VSPAGAPEDVKTILATDCGSTTTKAILIGRAPEGFRLLARGEAPTTVEAPFEDVTRGVLNAIQELEEISGRRILENDRIVSPSHDHEGVDLFVSTSSAGGGLQMMVAGVVKQMTAESAERCALGAGAIVMDVLASNDGRMGHQKIERIRQLRPDIILLSGGTEGGTISHVVEMAEYIRAADPRPRLGSSYKLPLIYAGNHAARDAVQDLLGEKTALSITENIRPSLERENLTPARDKIHDLFLEHVMAQAPGYRKLMEWVHAPIMPTPAAVGLLMEQVARRHGINLIGVDIGGATTDVFSVFDGVFHRSVSANLGMSYSVGNVLASAGVEKIMRWLPFTMGEQDLRNRVKNKMIRPTTIPQTVEDLEIEHALAREALRLALEQHKELAVGLKGIQKERSVSDAFDQKRGGSLVDMGKVDWIVGSGGILSHAPRRVQAMMMLMDAFEPVGMTELFVDSIFMMPHLGVLSTVREDAAAQVFLRDCLVPLGLCVAPRGKARPGDPVLSYVVRSEEGEEREGSLQFGEVRLVPLPSGTKVALAATPARGFDLGQGEGRRVTASINGGVVGVVLDGRGRPLRVERDQGRRNSQLQEWARAMSLYPDRKDG
jgi:uncharacterized protein (TIGR01319 family)